MKVHRIYNGDDNKSHVEDLEIPMRETRRFGPLFTFSPTADIVMRSFAARSLGEEFHASPRRQLVAQLSGTTELVCGDGSKVQVRTGELLLTDNTVGEGHKVHDLEGPVTHVYIPFPDDVDVSEWPRA